MAQVVGGAGKQAGGAGAALSSTRRAHGSHRGVRRVGDRPRIRQALRPVGEPRCADPPPPRLPPRWRALGGFETALSSTREHPGEPLAVVRLRQPVDAPCGSRDDLCLLTPCVEAARRGDEANVLVRSVQDRWGARGLQMGVGSGPAVRPQVPAAGHRQPQRVGRGTCLPPTIPPARPPPNAAWTCGGPHWRFRREWTRSLGYGRLGPTEPVLWPPPSIPNDPVPARPSASTGARIRPCLPAGTAVPLPANVALSADGGSLPSAVGCPMLPRIGRESRRPLPDRPSTTAGAPSRQARRAARVPSGQ